MQLKSEVTQLQLYYVALALLTSTTAVIWIWMHSYQGLALTAIRDDEDAARSSGVDVDRVKMLVFIYSAAITGLASGLYFMDVVIITPPSAFTISWAAYIVFIVVAGGMGTIAGPLVGAVLFIVIERLLGAAAGQGLLVLGILSIVLMLFLPRGVMGILSDISHKWRHRSGNSGRLKGAHTQGEPQFACRAPRSGYRTSRAGPEHYRWRGRQLSHRERLSRQLSYLGLSGAALLF